MVDAINLHKKLRRHILNLVERHLVTLHGKTIEIYLMIAVLLHPFFVAIECAEVGFEENHCVLDVNLTRRHTHIGEKQRRIRRPPVGSEKHNIIALAQLDIERRQYSCN